jgi:uncharacterized protein (TIGR02284 family)
MAKAMQSEGKLIHHLNELIELDLDAIEAYEAAISRLTDPADRKQLQSFMADHVRHVADLSLLVQESGGVPATAPDFKRILAKGKVVLLGIAGDIGVLQAMKSNEETSTRVYDKACQDPELPARAKPVLERNFLDEQKHLDWIEQRIAADHRRHETVRRSQP